MPDIQLTPTDADYQVLIANNMEQLKSIVLARMLNEQTAEIEALKEKYGETSTLTNVKNAVDRAVENKIADISSIGD